MVYRFTTKSKHRWKEVTTHPGAKLGRNKINIAKQLLSQEWKVPVSEIKMEIKETV